MVHTNLAAVYMRLRRFDLASQQLEIAANELKPDDSRDTRRTVYSNWGDSLARDGEVDSAIEKYEIALDVDPDSHYVLRELAANELRRNRAERAVDRLRQALEMKPNDGRTNFLLGLAYEAEGNPAGASAAFERAAELEPKTTDAIMRRARLLLRIGEREAAEAQYKKALAIAIASEAENAAVTVSTVQAQLAGIAMTNGDTPGAIDLYQQAITCWTDNYQANNNLAWMLATSPDEKYRDAKRAVELAIRACEILVMPDHATLGTLAVAQAANGDMPAAIETAKRAIDLATQENDSAAVEELRSHLLLFEQGQPYIALAPSRSRQGRRLPPAWQDRPQSTSELGRSIHEKWVHSKSTGSTSLFGSLGTSGSF